MLPSAYVRTANRLRRRAIRLRLRSQAPPSSDGDEGPSWRQGRQPRRNDERAQVAGPRRLHDLHRCVPRLPGGWMAEGARRRDRQAGRRPREEDGSPPRRSVRPVARQRAFRRQVLDARDDGHRPQLGAQRQEREGAGGGDERRALLLRLVSPVHLDVRTHRPRHRRGAVRASVRGGQAGCRGHQRCRPAGQRPQGAVHCLQGGGQGGDRQAVPPGPDQAAARCRRSGLQQLERSPGDRLSGSRADQPRPRYCRQRAGHGVRQPRRQLWHWRRLHPQRGHRREQALRRLPDQRPGRGRRRRHPQHGGPRHPRRALPGDQDASCSRSSTASSATTRTCATPSSPSSRASCGCCRPVSASAPAQLP